MSKIEQSQLTSLYKGNSQHYENALTVENWITKNHKSDVHDVSGGSQAVRIAIVNTFSRQKNLEFWESL